LNLLDAFSNAPLDAKRLFARLYLRKHSFIRVDSLKYPEISDPLKAIDDLVQIDFASNEVHDLEEALHILSAPELKKISVKGKGLRKADAIADILKETKGMRSVFGGSNLEPRMKQGWFLC
jgi:Fanconi-associated nuclease 1